MKEKEQNQSIRIERDQQYSFFISFHKFYNKNLLSGYVSIK